MKKRKNTGRTLLVIAEILFCAGVVYLGLSSIRKENALIFVSYAAHSVLVLLFSLVYSSSESFANTDRLFVKRFALFAIIRDGITLTTLSAGDLGISVVKSIHSSVVACLLLLQLSNLLGAVLFNRKSNPKAVRKYKFLSSFLCICLSTIIPYRGGLNETLNQAAVMLPVLAIIISIVFGIIAQFFKQERDSLPSRNLGIIAILIVEILQFFPFSLTNFIVCTSLSFFSLIWVILVEHTNNRRIS